MKSKDIRKLAWHHLQAGKSTRQVAEFTNVHQATIQRWKKRGPPAERQKSVRLHRRKLTPEQEMGMLDFVATTPGLFLDCIAAHMCQTHGIDVSARLISKILARSNITRKRGTRLHIRYDVERGLQFL